MITEDYVSFETAKLLKDKGFDERLLTFYITDKAKKEGYFQIMAFTDDKIDNNHSGQCYLAPTLQMAMKWLREVHKIGIFPSTYTITNSKGSKEEHVYGSAIVNLITFDLMCDDIMPRNSYEEACEAACIYALKNLI